MTPAQILRARAAVSGHAWFSSFPLTGSARITPAAGPFRATRFPATVLVGSQGAGDDNAIARPHFAQLANHLSGAAGTKVDGAGVSVIQRFHGEHHDQ